MNNKVFSIATALGLTLSAAATASDFRTELGAQYIDLDGAEAWGADASFYFEPVSTGTGPLAEAPFLNRASNFSLSYLRDTDGDFSIPAAGLEVYAGDFYLAASYSRFSNGITLNDFGARAGMMVAENTRVTLGYDNVELPFGFDLDIYTVGAKHLMLLDGDSALNLEGEFGVARNGSSEFAYAVQADYYFNRAFSIGARYSGVESDDQWGLGTRYFFTPRVSGGLEYNRADGDDAFGLRLAARF